MIGLVENCLKKTIERRILLQEEFTFLSCEVETVINSRPLTFIYDRPNSIVLRPIFFIQPDLKLGPYPIKPKDDDQNYVPPLTPQEKMNSLSTLKNR